MNKTLDLLDVKIIEQLGIYGPRNVSYIARKLGVPIETVRKRVKRLVSKFSMSFHANVYHTKIGLKKVFVFADAVPGYEAVLFECLKANDFWLYVGRYYGRDEGCYGIYGIPEEHTLEFEEFTSKLEEVGVARNLKSFWSTCLHTVNPRKDWFDPKSEGWLLKWDEWIDEIPMKGTKLPYTLVDSEEYPIKADYLDILILTKLQVNSATSFQDIAKSINVSPEVVSYRYKNHILKHGLLEKPQAFFLRFDKATSSFFVFIFGFDEDKKMARFASSLLGKPFVHTLGKIMGENTLVSHIYLPNREFRKFIDSLSELVRRGFLQTYEYVMEDFDVRASQTISYEQFKDGSWIYEHKKYVDKLQKLMRRVKAFGDWNVHPCDFLSEAQHPSGTTARVFP